MKSLEAIIDDIFIKEGDKYHVSDQPTGRGGITLAVLREFQPTAKLIDLMNLSHEDARGIIRRKLDQLLVQTGIGIVPYEPLRLQLLDFAYNSGPERAIRWFQRCLMVPRTGKLDQRTREELEAVGQGRNGANLMLLNEALMAARLLMVDMATDPGGSIDAKFEEGLENRALTFTLLSIP